MYKNSCNGTKTTNSAHLQLPWHLQHIDHKLDVFFQPIKVGSQTLGHRVVLAPLTRFRASKKAHVPITPLVGKYYTQRSTRPGTLLITEATLISPRAGGYDNVPGIWDQSQIDAWKEVCGINRIFSWSL